MTTTERTDYVVLGMGPAGEAVAGDLAEAGHSVIGIDKQLLGGECPYWGCIPSKMMLRAAHLLAEGRRIPGMAGSSTVQADWSPVAARIRDEATDDWDDTVAVERFEGKGGRFVRGHGRLVDEHTVEVDGNRVEAAHGIVVATGTVASIPPIPGIGEVDVWTNRDAVEAKELPGSLIVLGGGAIGVELGQVAARFGSSVTVLEAQEHLLPLDEPEAGTLLAESLVRDGIDVRTSVTAVRVADADQGVTVELDDGTRLSAERLLVATGRRVDLGAIGAATIGIDESARALPVDERMRVCDGVWAVGDVTGKGAFTHVGMYQAGIAVADILGREHWSADYRAVPRVTFTDPEVGSVGLTQRDAEQQGLRIAVGVAQVPSTARGWLHKAGNEGIIKLVADRDAGVLVGATSAGPAGGEVLGLLSLAVHARTPLAQLRSMIYAYPTFHRGIEDALRDLDA
jgi:pyruvate/2-oxoglutarate dehydrogenase complex dihydrolipoamide dehydrogenase (E3) component